MPTNEGHISIRWATPGLDSYIVPFPINISRPFIRMVFANTYLYSGLDNCADVRLCDFADTDQEWKFRVYKRPNNDGPGFNLGFLLVAK